MCPDEGEELGEIPINMESRDRISHLFLSDDITELKAVALRPKAQMIHHALTHTINPRTRSYEKVNRRDFQSLNAMGRAFCKLGKSNFG